MSAITSHIHIRSTAEGKRIYSDAKSQY